MNLKCKSCLSISCKCYNPEPDSSVSKLYITSYTYNILLTNGYINLISSDGEDQLLSYHKMVPLNYDLENLPSMRKNTSISFTVTDDYELNDESLRNYSISSNSISSSYNLNEYSYSVQRISNQSNILSLPDILNHNITVSPDQNISFDVP